MIERLRSVDIRFMSDWNLYDKLSESKMNTKSMYPTYCLNIFLETTDTLYPIIPTRDVNEARWPHTCCKPCAFEEKNRKKQEQIKIHPAQNTPRYPQQPGDRDHLETERDETHPTR